MIINDLMRQDFEAWCKWHKKRSCIKSVISYLKGPENRLIMHMRLHESGGVLNKVVGKILRIGTKHLNLYLWAPGKIDGGFTIMHGFCTVVNAAHIGKNFHVSQQVTIGWGPSGTPIIGNNVKVYAGAIIVGGVHIGDNAIIGAGTVVTKDIPENTLVVGATNRIIEKKKDE